MSHNTKCLSSRRRSSLAFRRKQSDEEVEEQARVERLKTLGKGKDTVFKISYQDKVTLFIELVRVVEGWLRLNSLDKETLVRPLVIFSNPVFNYWELMKRWQHEG